MDAVDSTLSLMVIVLTLVIVVLTAQFARRRRDLFTLRPIPAYEAVPDFAARSIESSRPLHLALGSAGIGTETTLLAIAAAELAYQVTIRAAIGDASPIVTLTAPSSFPLGQDTLRRAYQSRGLVERYRAENVRWYPAGSRSLAYAAAITALHSDDNTTADIFAGSFGPELALMLESSSRRRQPSIAVSDQPEGQAVAFALSEYPLIGEEIFAAGSYLDGGAVQRAESASIDVLRWLLIAVIIVAFIVGLVNNGG
ncbi:MAG: DUF6754 domain-containing protein [bacterium]|nr:DUF6754 domain-containing protein [bacterium]